MLNVSFLGYIIPLFRLQFWFRLDGQPFLDWSESLILAVMVSLVLLGGILYFLLLEARKWQSAECRARSAKDFMRRFSREEQQALRCAAASLFWVGVVGLFLYAMTWQRIPILSMRFFFLVWFVWLVWVIWKTYVRLFRLIPLAEAQKNQRASYEKWLPKPKKK